jgi:hypothetical protein
MKNDTPNPFVSNFRGSFFGLMQWDDLAAFWQVLREHAEQNWYIYAIGEAPPIQPVSADQLRHFVDEIDVLLRREHEEDYCGIVYVDSKTVPTYIKIYDPNNLGVVCGSSDNPPLPGWIISHLPPVDLQAAIVVPQSRRRWWSRLWA